MPGVSWLAGNAGPPRQGEWRAPLPYAAAVAQLRPLGKAGWAQLLDCLSGRHPLVVGMPNPASSATGIATLHELSGC
jgi:hypothetical protein